ncbi:MAG: hypothetical protein AAFY58_04780 [Planctomycetota bacterium]
MSERARLRYIIASDVESEFLSVEVEQSDVPGYPILGTVRVRPDGTPEVHCEWLAVADLVRLLAIAKSEIGPGPGEYGTRVDWRALASLGKPEPDD